MNMLDRFPAIKRGIEFSKVRLGEIEKEISKLDMSGANLIVNGSYARKEASEVSDCDYVIIFPKGSKATDIKRVETAVSKVVKKVVGKLPSSNGVFAKPIICGDLSRDIGGTNDNNQTISHRLLFLSEGLAVGESNLYKVQVKELIERYIQDTISDHQLALFFLNDVIRYWRTICVDFENKTFEKGKEWGDRNIKLVFSRRLLYFGGLLVAAETAQRSVKDKRDIFERLIGLSPLERIVRICGPNSERVLQEYDYFLDKMRDAKFRERMKKLKRESASSNEEFKKIKNQGHYFTFHLISLLQTTYSIYHPIHKCLIM